MPEVRITTFWDAKAKKGPFAYTAYHGKPRDLSAAASRVHLKWQADQSAKAQLTTVSDDVGKALAVHRQEASAKKMARCREAVAKAAAKKRARKTVKID
eukprot:1556659-Alexandrium_andersonii.AAC.1